MAGSVVTTGAACRTKLAVAVRAPVIVTTHVEDPLQAPPHPLKVFEALGVAVSVTVDPLAKLATHPVTPAAPFVIVQLIPAGADVTVPLPLPPPDTLRPGEALKVAVTERALVIDTVHGEVPVHAPLHPAKTLPVLAEAFSVTEAPVENVVEHPVAPATPFVIVQLMPAGVEVTVPLPVPPPETVRAGVPKLTETLVA